MSKEMMNGTMADAAADVQAEGVVQMMRTEEGRKAHAEAVYEAAYPLGKLTGPLGESGDEFDSILALGIGSALYLVSEVAAAIDPDTERKDGENTHAAYYAALSHVQAEVSGQMLNILSLKNSPEEAGALKDAAAAKRTGDEEGYREAATQAAGLMKQAAEMFSSSCSLMQSSQCWVVRSLSNAIFPLWAVFGLAREALTAEGEGKCPEEVAARQAGYAKSSLLWSSLKMDRLRKEIEGCGEEK